MDRSQQKKKWVVKKSNSLFLEQLPRDIIYNILVFVTHINTLKNIKSVCKQCLNILKDHNFWKTKFNETLPFFDLDKIISAHKQWSPILKSDPLNLPPREEGLIHKGLSINRKFEIYSEVSESYRLAHNLIRKLHYMKCDLSVIRFENQYDITTIYPINELIALNSSQHDLKIYGLVFIFKHFRERKRLNSEEVNKKKEKNCNTFVIRYDCRFLETSPNCAIIYDFNRYEFILKLSRLFYYFSDADFYLTLMYSDSSRLIKICGLGGIKKFLK